MTLAFKRQWKKDWLRGVVVVKLTVMVGLALYYFLPNEYGHLAVFASNMLWLWRT